MKLSAIGINSLKLLEGIKAKAYRDSGNVLTIGVGHTGLVNGKPITENLIIPLSLIDTLLKQDLVQFENKVNEEVTIKLSQSQFDALVIFCFNTGTLGNKLLKAVNSHSYGLVPYAFMEWIHVGKNIDTGLISRRLTEILIFTAGIYK